MSKCKDIIFAFLLLCSLICNTHAQTTTPLNGTELNKVNLEAEIDSTAIYQDLINQESARANYDANIVGMFAGGGVIGLGGLIFFLAVTAEPSSDKSNSFIEQFAEAMGVAVVSVMGGSIRSNDRFWWNRHSCS